MKKPIVLISLAATALLTNNVMAATAINTFSVGVTLTSVCRIVTVPTAAFTYSSFQVVASTISSSFTVQCTNTLPISNIALDATATTDQATNLAYTLALGTLPTVGTGIAQTVTITGSMAANQAGTCATATCTNAASTNKTRTLTITY